MFCFLVILLVLMTFILINNSGIYNVFAQSNENPSIQTAAGQMNAGTMGGSFISSTTEWIGVFALGITTGLLAFSNNISNNITTFEKRKKSNIVNNSIIIVSWSNSSFTCPSPCKRIYLVGNILFNFRYCSNNIWYNYRICKSPKINNMLYIRCVGNALLVLIFILV